MCIEQKTVEYPAVNMTAMPFTSPCCLVNDHCRREDRKTVRVRSSGYLHWIITYRMWWLQWEMASVNTVCLILSRLLGVIGGVRRCRLALLDKHITEGGFESTYSQSTHNSLCFGFVDEDVDSYPFVPASLPTYHDRLSFLWNCQNKLFLSKATFCKFLVTFCTRHSRTIACMNWHWLWLLIQDLLGIKVHNNHDKDKRRACDLSLLI